MTPFTISVPDDVLDDLQERLARVRFPDQLSDVDWDYGTDLAYMQELVEYWRDVYDWRIHETELNRLDHYTMPVNGLRLHFLHQRSPHPDALPLILTHGWPGSIVEFHKVIEPLTNPDNPEQAFHLVIPSIPGFGFSGKPGAAGTSAETIGKIWGELMARLGYERYIAQGGDWGAIVTTQIGLLDAEHLAGIHLNMVVAGPPAGVENPMEGVLPAELQALGDMGDFQKNETGYQRIQGTKPQTLGTGLNDSPAGLASWIVEKFRSWSDCGGDVESRFSKDELLTNIMIYWVTQTINSSVRLYCESMRSGRFGPTGQRVEVPTAAAIFPGEMHKPPRKWAEAHFDVRRWTEFQSGGHFPALEEPGPLVDDVRAFFRELR